jgi:hypothetical protein
MSSRMAHPEVRIHGSGGGEAAGHLHPGLAHRYQGAEFSLTPVGAGVVVAVGLLVVDPLDIEEDVQRISTI